MEIEINLNGNAYCVIIDTKNYTAVKKSTVSDSESKNYGKTTSTDLGYFSTLQNACKSILRNELASSPDKVLLSEFVSRIEAINTELTEQLNVLKLD